MLLFALASLVGAASDARADPARKGFTRHRRAAASPVDENIAKTEPPLRWYGWQIFAVDGSAAGLVLLDAALTEGEPTPILGLLFFVSPIVHALHGNPGRAAGSLGMRGVLPLVGGVIGMDASNCGLLGGECKGLDVGIALGFASAVVIDATWLAWEPDDAPVMNAMHLRPALEIGRDGAWLGLAGAL